MTGTLARRVFDRCAEQWKPSSQRDVLDCHLTAFFNGWLDYQGLYGEDRRWVAWPAMTWASTRQPAARWPATTRTGA